MFTIICFTMHMFTIIILYCNLLSLLFVMVLKYIKIKKILLQILTTLFIYANNFICKKSQHSHEHLTPLCGDSAYAGLNFDLKL